jgi:hypothetical protein
MLYHMSNAANGTSEENYAYELIERGDWGRTYDTAFVGHGDIYFVIDHYATEVSGDADGYYANFEIEWEWNGTWPIELPGQRDYIWRVQNAL